jgi:hypothetical protein
MAFTTGTPMFNSNVLNIIDIQNSINSSSGESVTQSLGQLTSMVDTQTNIVYANGLTAFTAGGNIAVTSPLIVNDAVGTSAFSNTSGDVYNLFVYGNVHASNYQSLCPLRFTVPSGEAMIITEAGNVGIGTSEPKAKLEVSGTTVFNDTVVFHGDVLFKGNVVIDGTLTVGGRAV